MISGYLYDQHLKRRRTRGFTIVELLIVVVVIAILAAVTIVAYNGISNQTRTAAYAATVDQAEKLIRMAASEGQIILPANDPQYTRYTTCLGKSASDFPGDGPFAEGECFVQEGISGGQPYSLKYSFDATTIDMLNSYADKLPKGLLPKTDALRGVQESMNTDIRVQGRGVILEMMRMNDGSLLVILTWAPPSQDGCGRGLSYQKLYADAGLESPYVGLGDLCALSSQV